MLLIHMKHYQTAPEHNRVRLRKRHKSLCPRYASSTVYPRCLMMFSHFANQQEMKFKTKSACCETAVNCSFSTIAPQLLPNPSADWSCPSSQKVGIKSRGIVQIVQTFSTLFWSSCFFLLWRSTRIYIFWWAGTSKFLNKTVPDGNQSQQLNCWIFLIRQLEKMRKNDYQSEAKGRPGAMHGKQIFAENLPCRMSRHHRLHQALCLLERSDVPPTNMFRYNIYIYI